jgi:hypothetical protein
VAPLAAVLVLLEAKHGCLTDPAFMPAFMAHLQQVSDRFPDFPGGAAAWWKQVAKPAIAAFYKSFSAAVWRKGVHTRRFFVRALDLARLEGDWVAV